jgi:hypothetical protein
VGEMSSYEKRLKLKEYETDDSEIEYNDINYNQNNYNGYERLEDDTGEYVEITMDNKQDNSKSLNNIEEYDDIDKTESAKIIVSLSQEKIKNICINNEKNVLLEVPCVKKVRSASFTAIDKRSSLLPKSFKNNGNRNSLGKISLASITQPIPIITTSDLNFNEPDFTAKHISISIAAGNKCQSDNVIYDVPRKHSLVTLPERKMSDTTFSYATPVKTVR